MTRKHSAVRTGASFTFRLVFAAAVLAGSAFAASASAQENQAPLLVLASSAYSDLPTNLQVKFPTGSIPLKGLYKIRGIPGLVMICRMRDGRYFYIDSMGKLHFVAPGTFIRVK